MPSPNSTLEGIVLNSVETGESHIILSIFSKKNGLSKVLLRTRKSVRFNSPPDYFDDVELVLNLPKDGIGLPFVKDFKVLNKRSGLATSHKKFEASSSIARLFLDNGADLQDVDPFFKLLQISLKFLELGHQPNCIFLKTLFQFGRLEGFAVKESWLISLSDKRRKVAKHILGTKLEDLEISEEILPELIQSLRNWLNNETELRC